jgi:type II secretory pathway component GspD/PulD (secretin)
MDKGSRRFGHRFNLAAAAILASLLILSAGAHGSQLAVIELNHRQADDVIPVITPFLGAGDTLSGKDRLLFLSTTPENLARIQSIIAHLDQASRQLAVTVVQGENALDTLGALSVSGSVTIGDKVTAGVGHRGQADDALTVDARSTQRTRNSSDVQRVLVQAGQTATIYVGLSEPVPLGSPTLHGMRHHQIQGYREVLTGVRVTPRLSGDTITLDIETRQDRPADGGSGAVRTQGIQTRVQGRLNEWIEIGGILSGTARREAGIVYGGSGRQASHHNVFIKIETQ